MSSSKGDTTRSVSRSKPVSTRGLAATIALSRSSRDKKASRSGSKHISRTSVHNAQNDGAVASKMRGNTFNPQTFAKTGLSQVQHVGGDDWQDRYDQLQDRRKRERADAIRNGLVADPDKPRTLAEAITLVGTCQDMCAEFERVERVVQKDVWKEETDPGQLAVNSMDREPVEARMIKKFRRAAAGIEEQLPSDLRPPQVLKKTCDYLFNDIVGNATDLGTVHHFVWDRTRAIRNDFSIQQISKSVDLSIAIDCYERIARFHMLSLHQLALATKPYEKYDWQQEREQLDRTLLSLMQYYDDSRGRIALPNEPEFRAYWVVFQLQDPVPDLEDRLQTLDRGLALHPRVRQAMALYDAACNVVDLQGPLKPPAHHPIAQQDWHKFWQLVESKRTSYLMACVAEIYFNLVRRNILHAILKSTGTKTMSQWSIEDTRSMLAFDDEEQVEEFCSRYDLTFVDESGQVKLDLSTLKGKQLPEAKATASKQTKSALVEQKRAARALPAIINGLSFSQATEQGLIQEVQEYSDMEPELIDASDADYQEDGDDMLSDDGLFVKEKPSAQQPEKASSQFQSQIESSIGKSSFGKPSQSSSPPLTFGKPSASPSVFDAASTKQVLNFGKPSDTTTASIFGNAASSDAAATMKAAPKFNFLPTAKQNEKKATAGFASPFKPFAPASEDSHDPPVTKSAISNPSSDTSSIFQQSTPFKNPFVSALNTTDSSPAKDTITKLPEPTTSSIDSARTTFPPSSIFTNDASKATIATAATQSQQPFFSFPAAGSSEKVAESLVEQPRKHVSFGPIGSISTASDKIPQMKTKEPAEASHVNSSAVFPSISITTATDSHPQSLQQKPAQDMFSSKKIEPKTVAPDDGPDLNNILARLANELTMHSANGFLQQYVDYAVAQVITDVQEQVSSERLASEAKDFRTKSLATRFGKWWRNFCRLKRLAKHGKDQRTRALRRLRERNSHASMASSLNSAQPGQSVNHINNHASSNRRDDIDRRFQQSVNGAHRSSEPVNDLPASTRLEAQSRTDPMQPPAVSKPRRVDQSGRIVKPTSGQRSIDNSRSHTTNPSLPPVRSTTKSNYFRAKAMGVDMSTVQVKSTRKRGYSEMSNLESNASSNSSQGALSASMDIIGNQHNGIDSLTADAVFKLHKSREEDDALFARLRAARESLSEGLSFYQTQSAKPAIRQDRSRGDSSTSTDSPSLILARQKARELQNMTTTGDVPAYRLRESRFVPRDQYDKAVERARSIRESRSVTSSRPQSRADFGAGNNNFVDLASNGVSSARGSHHSKRDEHIDPILQDDHSNVEAFGIGSTRVPDAISFTNGSTSINDYTTAASNQAASNILSKTTSDLPQNETLALEHDFTIKPSQIPQSLSASFGSKYDNTQEHQPHHPHDHLPLEALTDHQHIDNASNGIQASSNPFAALYDGMEDDDEDEDEEEHDSYDDNDNDNAYVDEAVYNGDDDGYDELEEDLDELGSEEDVGSAQSEATSYVSDDDDGTSKRMTTQQEQQALQLAGNTEDDAIELSD